MSGIIGLLINVINLFAWLLVVLVLVKVLLSYFLSPYEPIRQFVDRLVEPMLIPIRRFIQPVGMFDFSPLVLIVLIQIITSIFTSILNIVF